MNVPISADRVRALCKTPPMEIEPYKPRLRLKRYDAPKDDKRGRLLAWLQENKKSEQFTAYEIPQTIAKDWRSATITMALLFRQGLLKKIQDSNGHGRRTIYKLKAK